MADSIDARTQRLADAPVMLFGAPRSGTTWAQRLLLADPRCCGSQESHFFVTFGRALHDFDDKASRERRHGLACYWQRGDFVAELASLWQRTVAPVITAAPEATVLVEKTPDHALWLESIAEIVPAARFIHVVRDSRAVCASLLAASRYSWGERWAPSSVDGAIDVWRRHVEAVRAFTGDVATLRYEDLHGDRDLALRALFDSAGLDLDAAACAGIFERAESSSQFAGTGDVAESVEPAAFRGPGTSESWRETLPRRDQKRIWRATAELMASFGYEA